MGGEWCSVDATFYLRQVQCGHGRGRGICGHIVCGAVLYMSRGARVKSQKYTVTINPLVIHGERKQTKRPFGRRRRFSTPCRTNPCSKRRGSDAAAPALLVHGSSSCMSRRRPGGCRLRRTRSLGNCTSSMDIVMGSQSSTVRAERDWAFGWKTTVRTGRCWAFRWEIGIWSISRPWRGGGCEIGICCSISHSRPPPRHSVAVAGRGPTVRERASIASMPR